ncbi:MAG: hypothetical protein QME74_06335 [Candidatus Edwardsbacteria bacterium]|nr:hypothetical protein [Candidatus Edwardsbacteria bacterium]
MKKSKLDVLGDRYLLRPTFDIIDHVGGIHGFDVFDEDENFVAHYDVDNESEVESQIKCDFYKVAT